MSSWICALALVGCVAVECLVGCAPDHTWHGDTSFTLEERAAIETANEWLASRLGDDAYAIVWDLPPGDEAPAYSIRNGRVPAPFMATREHHRIRIDTSMFSPGPYRIGALTQVTAHEFGHERGMEHHEGEGLMNPIEDTALHWTSLDEDECKRVSACR